MQSLPFSEQLHALDIRDIVESVFDQDLRFDRLRDLADELVPSEVA